MTGDSGSGRQQSREDHSQPATTPGDSSSPSWLETNLAGPAGGPANITPASLLEQALADRQRQGDLAGQAQVLARLAVARYAAGDASGAGEAAAECVRAASLAGDRHGWPWAVLIQALLAYDRDDLDEALARAGEALDLFRASGDTAHVWRATMTCMLVTKSLGRLMEARDYCLETIDLVEECGDEEMATALPELAAVVLALGDTPEAVVVYSAGLTAAERLGVRYPPTAFDRYRARIARARSRLPEAEFAAARAEGEALSLGEALEQVRRSVSSGRGRTTLPA